MKIKKGQVNQNTSKYQILIDERAISYSHWIESILVSDDFVLAFNQALAESDFEAYFWEVKPTNKNSLNDDFEFVLVNSRSLSLISADNTPFNKYFDDAKAVVHFPNISGDAELVVPTPLSPTTEYAHLADFVRTADELQIIAFWRMVAETFRSKVGPSTKWLSTSGLGVHWLHVRIDCQPKYFQYKEYRTTKGLGKLKL